MPDPTGPAPPVAGSTDPATVDSIFLDAARRAAEIHAANEYVRHIVRTVADMGATPPRSGTRRPDLPAVMAHNAAISDYIVGRVTRDGTRPDAVTVREIASATGINRNVVFRSAVWTAFSRWRDHIRTDPSVRAKQLTAEMLAVLPAATAYRPDDEAAEREVAAMTTEERERMIRVIAADQARDAAAERRGCRRNN